MRTMPVRAYADTSVFGGVMDPEFSEASRRFFDYVRDGRVNLVVNFRRIPLYNAVNALMGYPPVAIHSPREVLFDEEGV